MMTVLNFMTAIYWGQLSKCESVATTVAQYSCTNPDAYGAVCAFSVMMFLVQLFFTGGSIMWRGELISEAGLYDDLPQGSAHASGMPYESSSQGKSGPPPSADL